jgi:hypothetical protein
MVGTGIAVAHIAQWFEEIFFNQVENGDAPLLLNIGVAPQNRCFVQFNLNDAWVAHSAVLASDNFGARGIEFQAIGRVQNVVHSHIPALLFLPPCGVELAKG